MMGKSVEQRLGNYQLRHLIGRGGFAEVYYGEHIYLKTPAAIKVLTVQITPDEREKFLHEARIAANLTHKHIVTVLEFGVERGIPYLVMDYAAHGTLRQRYPKGTRLLPEQIVPYVQQIASALHYTHRQQLVHRDLKPENMLLDQNDTILLSDFGIAQLVQSTQGPTNELRIVGTVAYMAPEQLRGEAVPASDQYALAAVVYEWLCGEPPFRGSFAEVALQHTFAPPQPLQERLPSLAKSLAEVVALGLAKEPAARFQSVEAFARAFTQASLLKEVGAFPVPVLARPAALPAVNESSSLAAQEKRQSGRALARRRVLVGLIAGVGLAATGTALAWKPLAQLLLPHHVPISPKKPTLKIKPTLPPTTSAPGTTLYTFHGHPAFGTGAAIQGIAWLPDSQRIISAADDIQFWMARTGKVLSVYREGEPGSLFSINTPVLSAKGQYLAFVPSITQADGTAISKIEVLEIETQQIVHTIQQSTDIQTMLLAWSPDESMLAAADYENDNVQVWDLAAGKVLTTYQGHRNSLKALAWSPDGTLIASADGNSNDATIAGTVHLWEPATGKPQQIYSEHASSVNALAWSPDGKSLASGGGVMIYGGNGKSVSDNTVRIWSPDSKHARLTYTGHNTPVNTLTWSPDGKFVASGCSYRAGNVAPVQLWNASSGQGSLSFQGQGNGDYNGAWFLAWSPDGKMLASAQTNGSIPIWQVG